MISHNSGSRNRPVRGRAMAASLFCGAVVSLALAVADLDAQSRAASSLYEEGGVKAESVRQGKLGSCYFHSVIAALAHTQPDKVRGMIQTNADRTYTVQFADGKKETAYPEDIQYSRDSGYEKSDGLWVAVLFRAYAQRVLRQSLADAVQQSDLFSLVKPYVVEAVNSNDSVLLAYDRSIRQVVDQDGKIDRVKLETELKNKMQAISLPDSVKDSLVGMLDSRGVFAALGTTIKENGEIFGAYRAVGQGGMAGRVMEAFAGSKELTTNDSEDAAAGALNRGTNAHAPMVACTGASRYHDMRAQRIPLPPDTGPWFIDSHCYTVMGFDAGSQTVTLRNPWGDQPYPDGILRLPISSFVPGFNGVMTTGL